MTKSGKAICLGLILYMVGWMLLATKVAKLPYPDGFNLDLVFNMCLIAAAFVIYFGITVYTDILPERLLGSPEALAQHEETRRAYEAKLSKILEDRFKQTHYHCVREEVG